MPGKIKEFVKEIRNEHATLEFGAQGLETVGSVKKASALREKWLGAFKLNSLRKEEKAKGGPEAGTRIKVQDQYYVFTK
jgi:hypothetical protein